MLTPWGLNLPCWHCVAFHKANKLSSNITWVHSRTLNEIPYFQDRASCGRVVCSNSTNLYGTNQLAKFFWGKDSHLCHTFFFTRFIFATFQGEKYESGHPQEKKGTALPSMMTSHWLHENSIPKIGCHYFWAAPIAFPKNNLPIWTLGYCRSPKHSRILKNCLLLSLNCSQIWLFPLLWMVATWQNRKKTSHKVTKMWYHYVTISALSIQTRAARKDPKLHLFGRIHYQGFFWGLWLVTPTKVFLLNCF
jgi:hypothetical protein